MKDIDTCFNPTEEDERTHLDQVKGKIKAELIQISEKVSTKHSEMIEMKAYLHESKADMDHVEKISVRQAVDQIVNVGKHGEARRQRMDRLLQSPYFGRIDVQPESKPKVDPIYLGIHSFHDDKAGAPLIHDWRAPISSMFYDFEIGPAFYDAPDGRTECQVVRKRQYRIEKGELVFMLETSLNIHDDVLQRELSRASDDKMKNIVATIQRDQNAIIRNDEAHALIIQGAAGSGKTSIALHRIAFLLYKFKDTISSNEILIISPNKVFAHYISQVLPELGEEMIKETTMEILANHLLDYTVSFQTFYEQVSVLLMAGTKNGNAKFAERIQFKSTSEFLKELDDYARQIRNRKVRAKDITLGQHTIPAGWIVNRFRACGAMPFPKQIIEVTEAIVDWMRTRHQVEITGKNRSTLRTQLKRMLGNTDLHLLYENFFIWLGRPEMFVLGKDRKYEYADVFPLVYLKMQLEGMEPHHQIKHLVIDEMQDYSAIQYRVLAYLFPCRKTVLGDFNQSVNPLSSSTAEGIRDILPGAQCMYMNQSYRSTIEITEFAQRIQRNPNLVPIERHGPQPEILAFRDEEHEMEGLLQLVQTFLNRDYHSLGIICKTQHQANSVHDSLKEAIPDTHLLNAQSTVFRSGIIIATAHLAKGLEFDQVIVPFCSDGNYHNLIDRHMLYVACTRAMHLLHLTYTESNYSGVRLDI